MKKILPLLLNVLLLQSGLASAQNTGMIWYFGEKAGLDFSSGNPVEITDGVLKTLEGSAVATNKYGHLLFYTDGLTVYDRRHRVMQNGNGLSGHPSSTQSSVIVQKPGEIEVFYIFTVDDWHGENGLRYSVVDMRLNDYYGAITSKNVKMIDRSCEKVAILKHANEAYFWIVVHGLGTNHFSSYLLSDQGIDFKAVDSYVGGIVPVANSGCIGQLKGNSTSNKIANVNYNDNTVDVFNFDNITGKLSNRVILNDIKRPYGVEFSPNGKYMYVSEIFYKGGRLLQFDLSSKSEQKIRKSMAFIHDGDYKLGALQIAPDQKIYMANPEKKFLSVIESPDSMGGNCDFKVNGFNISRQVNFGLPCFSISVQPYINFTDGCVDEIIHFGVRAILVDSIHWYFDDKKPWEFETSFNRQIAHVFDESRIRRVEVGVYYNGICDKITAFIRVDSIQPFTLGKDRILCKGDSILLTTPLNLMVPIWQDGTEASIYMAKESGTYTVRGKLGACNAAGRVVIQFETLPNFNLGNDTALCEGDTLTLRVPYFTHYPPWIKTDSFELVRIGSESTYVLEVGLDKCKSTSSKTVHFDKMLKIDLGEDVLLCDVKSHLVFSPNTADIRFLWNDGSRNSYLNVSETGIYVLNAERGACTTADTVMVTFKNAPRINLGSDTILCVHETKMLEVFASEASYKWQDGSTDSVFLAVKHGVYVVRVQNICGVQSDTIALKPSYCGCAIIIPNAFTPNGNGLNERFNPVVSDYAMKQFTLEIYNRWGQKVYYGNQHNEGWDGTYQGRMVPTGVFVYKLDSVHFNGEMEQRTGTLYVQAE